MSSFTINKAKKVEQQVCNTLNKADRGIEYTMCKDDYSPFDLYGVGEHKHFEIIEVKQRAVNNWSTWFIEERKIKNMFKEMCKASDEGNTMEAYLVIVADDKMCMYNIEDIADQPVETIKMNATTAVGFNKQGVKVDKRVYNFPKTLKHIVL